MPRTNKNSNKRNPKSKGYPRKSKEEQENKRGAVIPEKEVKKRGLDNDPNWYFTDPVLAQQAAQLSFNQFLGSDETLLGRYTVPTIAVLMLNPSPGNTYPELNTVDGGKTSGFNMAMTKLYNRLSMKSGRNMAYEPQDIGTMYLAQGEIVSMVTHVRRAFAIAQTYNQRNRMFPKQVIAALGFDPDDFFANFSNYRMRMNTLLASINQIPILTESGYLRKCNAVYSGIYMDADSSMAQLYIPVPYSTWILDETADQRGSILRTVNVCAPESGHTAGKVWRFVDFLQQVLEPMVEALLTSSTLNLVYADMLNLAKYENIKFAAFEMIKDEDVLIPQYDEMTLKQFHNMTLMGPPSATSETTLLTVYNNVVPDQTNACIKYSPAFPSYGNTKGFSNDGSEIIIDTNNSDPDLTERIEITRYTGAYDNSWTGTDESRLNIGSSVPDHYGVIGIIYGNHVNDASAKQFRTYYYEQQLTKDVMIALSQFDWHPIVMEHDDYGGRNEISNVFADLGAYATVRSPYIRRLNQVIYMGLFDIRG